MPNLPPYPQPVTDILKVNTERSAEAYVRTLLSLPLTDPRYQRDINGTKCNFYVTDFLHLMGRKVVVAKANDLITRWSGINDPDEASEVNVREGVILVNQGRPVIATLHEEPHGHVMILLPQGDTDSIGDVLIANVGAANFYGRQLVYAVPRSLLPGVRLFAFP